jgi:hypothetical protein
MIMNGIIFYMYIIHRHILFRKMEQQQIELDETFMRNNGFQCKPISEYPVRLQALFIKREREERNEEDDGDSELVKTIKRLRKNKIHCQPYDYLNVKLQAMMMRGPMSLDDALGLQQQQLESLHSPPVLPQYPLPPVPQYPLPPVLPQYPLPPVPPVAAAEVAAEAAAQGARRQADIDAQYFRDLLAGRYKAPSSPIDIRPGKKGGKKRSYKKRTNTKKRSTKKRTNAKKRSYKKRN